MLATSSVCVADEPRPLIDSLSGLAKSEYIAGRTLFTDGDYAGALVKFQSSLDASHDARLLWNLGSCKRNLRRYAEALRYFERYRAEAAAQLSDKDREEVDAIVTALRPFVAALTLRADQPEARVALDEQEIGGAPLDKYLVDLGNHRVVVTKQGFLDYRAPLVVTGNADIVLDLHLLPAPHEGRLVVHAGAGDVIAIDGLNVGVGAHEMTIKSGGHTISVSARGRKTYTSRIELEDGQTRTLDITLEPTEGLPTWAWIGIGAGAVAAISIGTYLLFKPSSSDTSSTPVIGSMPPGTVQFPSLGRR
jgi:hypothetical protein